jgi:hypothetical protein
VDLILKLVRGLQTQFAAKLQIFFFDLELSNHPIELVVPSQKTGAVICCWRQLTKHLRCKFTRLDKKINHLTKDTTKLRSPFNIFGGRLSA